MIFDPSLEELRWSRKSFAYFWFFAQPGVKAMELSDFAKVEWLKPWDQYTSTGFEEELRKEVSSKHPLYGRRAITVGRRGDCDEVLYFLPDSPDPLAVVHLTWRMKTEPDPRSPHTTFFTSLDDWIHNCMKPDHRDYMADEEF